MNGTTSNASLREFTLKAVIFGLVFGVLFGAANAYLGLKAGLTVSTSIPIAVLAAALFRFFPGGGTILEANMAQTIGSASSSLASGVIFTIPALFLWGEKPSLLQIAGLAFCGGVLGILAMIPLRRLLIVQSDTELPYPEGRACAEVLRSSQRESSSGRWVFLGLGFGLAVKLVLSGAHWLPEEIETKLGFLPNASLAIKIAPALLAVGFIVGFKASSVMVSGSLLAALVFLPLMMKIHGVAAGNEAAVAAAKSQFPGFLRYLGAGAIAAAGILTIVRTAPTMAAAMRAVIAGMRRGGATASTASTDRDVPARVLFSGLLVLALALALVPGLLGGELGPGARALSAFGVILFGLLFVPVSSRLVGVIGVSSNPTSAMALITLAGTAGLYLLAGFGGSEAKIAVLTVGTVVCVAASKAGDISQDLKTGHLVGATPALQQYGQLLAAGVACFAVAAVIVAIGQSEGFGEGGMPAPQATLMKTVVEAVLGESLPWDLVAMGAAIGLVGALAGLPALPLALGLYLPLSTMATVFLGGFVRRLVEGKQGASTPVERGILCASGFVAGEGLAGVLLSGWAFWQNLGRVKVPAPSLAETWISLGLLVFACVILFRAGRSRETRNS